MHEGRTEGHRHLPTPQVDQCYVVISCITLYEVTYSTYGRLYPSTHTHQVCCYTIYFSYISLQTLEHRIGEKNSPFDLALCVRRRRPL